MEIDRKQVIKYLLQNISWISDKDYQKRVWIEGIGPECYSYDDAVNGFFGDGEPVLKNYENYGLNARQYNLLKKFRDEFKIFSDENPSWPPLWIDSPEWAQIMERAKEVLVIFNYKKESSV